MLGDNLEIPVIRRNMRKNFIARYKSIASAGISIGKPPGAICDCINGKRKSAYGSLWEVAEVKNDSRTR